VLSQRHDSTRDRVSRVAPTSNPTSGHYFSLLHIIVLRCIHKFDLALSAISIPSYEPRTVPDAILHAALVDVCQIVLQ
jgi:hypothetical protein